VDKKIKEELVKKVGAEPKGPKTTTKGKLQFILTNACYFCVLTSTSGSRNEAAVRGLW